MSLPGLIPLQGVSADTLTGLTAIPVEETRKIIAAVHRRRHPFNPPAPIPGVRRTSLTTLQSSCHLPSLKVKHTASSAVDPFQKVVFETHDGEVVEAVRIPLEREGRFTVCVSSQAGCAMGCTFCATGRLGLRRNLETWEIVEQIRTIRLKMIDDNVKGRVHGVVFQGMGEPLANTDNVLAAIGVLSDPAGSQIHAGNITVSTSGLPVGIRRLAREAPKALSIGSARPEVRRQIMPVEKVHPLLGEVLDAVVEHAKLTEMQPLWAVTPLRGQNDSAVDAAALADLAKRFEALTDGIRPRISVIPYNSVGPGDPYQRVPLDEETIFRTVMRDMGVFTHKRYSGGGDVAAACGQLAGTIAEGGAKDEATTLVPAGDSVVVNTWSGSWRTAPGQTPALFFSPPPGQGGAKSGQSLAAASSPTPSAAAPE